jgi:hypothetical protein
MRCQVRWGQGFFKCFGQQMEIDGYQQPAEKNTQGHWA